MTDSPYFTMDARTGAPPNRVFAPPQIELWQARQPRGIWDIIAELRRVFARNKPPEPQTYSYSATIVGPNVFICFGSASDTQRIKRAKATLDAVEGLRRSDLFPRGAEDQIIRAAKAWVDKFVASQARANVGWIEPLVTVSPDGEVVFEWWREARKVTVYITTDGSAQYLKVWGDNIHTDMDEGVITSPEDAEALWRWLAA